MLKEEYKKIVDAVIKANNNDKNKLKYIIGDINGQIGSIPDEALVYAAALLKIKQRTIFEVANSNKAYSQDSRGENCIYICDGRVCHARNSKDILVAVRKEVGLEDGEVTTTDKKFTVETVNCLGDCGNGPVIKINNRNFPKMNIAKAIALVNAMKKGTKIGLDVPKKKVDKNEFEISGCVAKAGLVKVPLKTTFRQIIDQYAGGMKDEHNFKAVLVGSTKTGCWFYGEDDLDKEIDLNENTELVRYLSKKGMVVYDDSTCMVDMTRKWMIETMKTSCGRCIPCSEGTRNIVIILNRIIEGDGFEEDFEDLDTFADTIKNVSMCGIGKMAANPTISLIKHFPDELKYYIENKHSKINKNITESI